MLEAACIGTVESGKMTKDLALLVYGPQYVSFLFQPKSAIAMHFLLLWLIAYNMSFQG